MAGSTTQLVKLIFLVLIFITFAVSPATSTAPDECRDEATNSCVDKAKALPLKIIALAAILVTSMIGVSAPLFSKSVPFLRPDSNIFIIVKCFASGIILGTGFMHVLPDSFDMLSSKCLADKPWHKFPFTGFVAMLSGLITLAIDSMATSLYIRKNNVEVAPGVDQERASPAIAPGHGHGHVHNATSAASKDGDSAKPQLLRYRVIAMVLELGIIVHSVVIGLSLGATNDTCTIKGLIAALCFHQMFEGMGLGGCILQAEYANMKKFLMAFFFAVTTPFGIALGIALSSIYRDNSPMALITVGLLNACSAGLLIYMALVDLLAAEFMGARLQGSIKLQVKSLVAALIGCGGMSLLAKWA
ncbi:PREDICTED: fe(2+) transport protein 1 [Tarenaya hassleriana]|uniref:fe(2+) transport protein 1 n=1 Tax=Tarenaya hassleriana TaxID=28532 RepID=UPI00053C0AAD|nr:PREDICTED: fe(2+) transport protein 1 [Tarenaya hassleriana]